jgi:hypothetical protein
MKRLRGAPFITILAILIIWTLGNVGLNQKVDAQSTPPSRYKSVEVKTTQYVWNLVNQTTGIVICEVTIDREGSPTNQDALTICQDKILPPTQTPPSISMLSTLPPVKTGAPFNANQYFRNTFWRFVTKRDITRVVKVPLPEIVLNITVPPGPSDKPYITLSAYEPVSEYAITSIQGTINQAEFICDGSQCDIPINEPSQITFRGYSSFGDHSQDIQASIQIVKRDVGYTLTLASLTPFTIFQDVCADTWGKNVSVAPKWAEFPQLPNGLDTNKSLFFLTSRLISTGIVNASSCPGEGFLSASSPNACGMDAAKQAAIEWQNQYDPLIWDTSRRIGIPPKIIKTLIEKESQFWPGNSRLFLQEFGLAQINEIGADVALRWDKSLFTQTCEGVLADCSTPYASLPSWQQSMIRGSLMTLINSECPGCVNGMDETTVKSSIDVIGHVLKANCSQTNFIMKDNSTTAAYEDLWKFTLVSYHSGYQCLNDAVDAAFQAGMPNDWKNVSSYLKCPGAKQYVDDFWANLVDFDNHVQLASVSNRPLQGPTFVPTRTPIPTATPVLSRNTIRVFVYVEIAGKQFPNDMAWADGVPVQVITQDGTVMEKKVVNGQVTFDMSAFPVGTEVTISLPGLYRSFATRLTDQGEILVPFRLKQPELPPVLP